MHGTRGDLIYERYRKDHENEPGKGVIPRKSMYCPNELIPYIKEEIAHRWGALTAFYAFPPMPSACAASRIAS